MGAEKELRLTRAGFTSGLWDNFVQIFGLKKIGFLERGLWREDKGEGVDESWI